MRCSAVSLVGGGDHSILPSPGGASSAPAFKETLAWPSKGPICLPRPWPTASPWGGPQVCGVGGR